MTKLIIILPCLMIMFQPLNAKVEATNDFNVETLTDFFPGKDVKDIESKYGKGEDMGSKNGIATKKHHLSHIRYKFPILVQYKEDKVEDFFARLPSYFLHDVFFQSLVNRYGKQTTYKKVGEEAYYVWEKPPLKHVYSAACTITCFPIFYAVERIDSSSSLLQKMKKSH